MRPVVSYIIHCKTKGSDRSKELFLKLGIEGRVFGQRHHLHISVGVEGEVWEDKRSNIKSSEPLLHSYNIGASLASMCAPQWAIWI